MNLRTTEYTNRFFHTDHTVVSCDDRMKGTTLTMPFYADPGAQAASLRKTAADLTRMADQLIADSRPVEPTVPGGTDAQAILFAIRYPSKTYHYAAVGYRYGNAWQWSLTGSGNRRYRWAELLEFIGSANWHSIQRVDTATFLHPRPYSEAADAESRPPTRFTVPFDNNPARF